MLTTPLVFLLQTLFDLYIYVLMLRLLLQAARINYLNPLAQFSLRFTQPIIHPLQRILPEIKGVDLAILFWIVALTFMKYIFVLLIQFHMFPQITGLLLLVLASIIEKFLMFYFYLIIIRALLSWIVPAHHNAIFFALAKITDPILRPIRRWMPMIGGFDLSPIVALIVLQLLILLIVNPLDSLALQFM